MVLNSKKIYAQFGKAVKQYSLLEDGDKVLVALSGGKDSLLLTELLTRQSRVFKPRFSVEVVHVRMENIDYKSDTTALQRFCDDLHVPLHIVTTSFDEVQPEYSNAKPPCFLCSWARRKAIFRLAQQLGCNKIALGHHMDDIVHTALMNLCYEGRFSSMPALLRMEKMPLTLIRPLCMVSEADIVAHAKANNYPQQLRHCPFEHDTKREYIRRLFAAIEQDNPEARFSIWHALEHD